MCTKKCASHAKVFVMCFKLRPKNVFLKMHLRKGQICARRVSKKVVVSGMSVGMFDRGINS